MVFTVRYMLGAFLVLISCSAIQTASLPLNQNYTKTDLPPTTTLLNDITTTNPPELETLATTTDSPTSTTTEITTILPNDSSSKKLEIESKPRTENARALDFDISRFTSPEFHNKNNVYNLPTSPENERFISSDFDHPTTYKFNYEITTPAYLESLHQQIEHGIYQDLNEEEENVPIQHPQTPSLEDLIERTKQNNTETNLDFLRYTNTVGDSKDTKNSIHHSSESEKAIHVDFDSAYNDTKVINEGVLVIKRPLNRTRLIPIKPEEMEGFGSTTRRTHPTKLSVQEKNSVFSNKIEKETIKPLTERIKLDPVGETTRENLINVHKRGSTKFTDTTQRNKLPEQNVQENNIYSVIVPQPSTTTTESTTTMKLYEMTNSDESEEVTHPSSAKDLLAKLDFTTKETFYEMTVDLTTISPLSRLLDTTTQESTTEMPKTTPESERITEKEEEEETSTPEYLTTTEATTLSNLETTSTEAATTESTTLYQVEVKEISTEIQTTTVSEDTTTILPTTRVGKASSSLSPQTTEFESEVSTIPPTTNAPITNPPISNPPITKSPTTDLPPTTLPPTRRIKSTPTPSKKINETLATTKKPKDKITKDKVNTTESSQIHLDIPVENGNLNEEEGDMEVDVTSRKPLKSNQEEIDIVHIKAVDMEHTTLHTEIKKPDHTYPNPEIIMSNNSSPPPPLPRTTTEEQNVGAEEGLERTDEESNSGKIIAIVLSTVGAVSLVLVAGLLFIMRRRQKRFNYGQRCTPVSLDAYSMDNVSVYNSVRRKAALRGSKRSYGNPAFDDSTVSNPLNFQNLIRFASNVEDIHNEYEEVPQVTARMTELPEGCDTKNRYANVIPLPETRVFLTPVDGDATADYINANYVTGPKGVKNYYIACQAPLQSTVNDFWRMIWEQQSKVIIMLTHLFENGIEKCVDYLPPSEVLDCHRLFGDYQVTLKNREVKDKYIISSLQLKNMVTNSWREVTHFWYSGWPEKGVPTEENSLIACLLEARSYIKLVQNNPEIKPKEASNGNFISSNSDISPVVVHCSPGTGRTGTVIACDIAIREFELKRVVDIPKIVYRIRRDRASSVQTKDQYNFIYKVINLYATKLTGGALDSI